MLLINCIGLLPGTLAADLDGDYAELHLLDASDNPDPQILVSNRRLLACSACHWRRTMTELLALSTLGLMLSLFLGLLRVLRGPGAGDRMLATQLIGTTGVGMLLLLSLLLDQPALIDVALILALLAAVAAAAFTGQQRETGHD